MKFIGQIKSSLRSLYYSEATHDQPWLNRAGVYLIRYTVHILRELNRDQCWLRASALTFTTLMTLIPILVLLFVTFRAFGGLNEASLRVQGFLFKHLLPESVTSIQGYIERLVLDFNAQAVSYVSITFLIGAAYSLFSSVDSSLNVIWGASKSRRFLRQVITMWAILTIIPLLLGYSLYLTTRLEAINALGIGVVAAGFFTRLMPYLLTLVSFTLLYKLVPKPEVRLSSAILGGMLAAFLWEVSKYGFNFYVSNLSNYQLLYGSFLTLPVFLIWVNLSWLILLLGAEVAYTHQNLGMLHLNSKRQERARKDVFLMSEKLGVHLLFLIADAYLSGQPVNRTWLNLNSPGSGWMVDSYLQKFQEAGFILIDENGLIVPARDPSTLSVNDILDYFEPSESEHPWDNDRKHVSAAEGVLGELNAIRREVFSNRDLRSEILKGRSSGARIDKEKT